jgi:hypothetical protein
MFRVRVIHEYRHIPLRVSALNTKARKISNGGQLSQIIDLWLLKFNGK